MTEDEILYLEPASLCIRDLAACMHLDLCLHPLLNLKVRAGGLSSFLPYASVRFVWPSRQL